MWRTPGLRKLTLLSAPGVFWGSLGAESALAQGGGTSGITDSFVRALSIHPSTPATIYAGTGSGVFKSTNGGASWTAVNTGLTFTAVSALAIDPSAPTTLYAAAYDPSTANRGGVFKSTNGGTSWTAANSGFPGVTAAGVLALAIDPSAPATLYAGTGGDGVRGVFKSTNGGGSWSAVVSGLPRLTVNALAIDPATPATLYAGTSGGGVFKSTNGGTSWTAVSSGLALLIQAVVIDPSAPDTLYAGTSGGGVFKSTDRGASWTAINTGLARITFVLALAISPSTPATIYAEASNSPGGPGRTYKSTNGGASWTAVSPLVTNGPTIPGFGFTGTITAGVVALAIDPSTPATLYAGTSGYGVFKSTDGAANWQRTGAPRQRMISISPGDSVDPGLSAPHLVSPAEGAVFNTFPRRTTLQWQPSPGADSYILEWDYGSGGVWNAEANRLPGLGYPVRDTQFSFDFVGAQIGRWRVWPVGVGGRRGAAPSEWRTFRYTR